MDKRDLLTIGETAARAGVSVPTLRFYDSKGLVHSTRTSGNQRRYPTAHPAAGGLRQGGPAIRPVARGDR